MLYLNAQSPSKLASWSNLTLTSVVFEFSGNVVFYIHLKNLTLTSVVFEYSFSTEIKWDAVI